MAHYTEAQRLAVLRDLARFPTPRPPAPPEPRDPLEVNKEWRDGLKGRGGHSTTVNFTPEAWSAVQARRADHPNVSALVCASLESPPLTHAIRRALDQLRYEFPACTSDTEAIEMATRWLVQYLDENKTLKTMHLGVNT